MVVGQVILYPTSTLLTFIPFAITASVDGQTIFTLPSSPNSVLVTAIQGVLQSQAAGDFTIENDKLILTEGVDSGTLIAGIYV